MLNNCGKIEKIIQITFFLENPYLKTILTTFSKITLNGKNYSSQKNYATLYLGLAIQRFQKLLFFVIEYPR